MSEQYKKLTDTYKKLTESELKTFGILVNSKEVNHDQYRNFVKKYYPSNAVLIEVIIDSEYNDEGYDVSFKNLLVYDFHGEELVPIRETREKCRVEMNSLGQDIASSYHREEVENFFVRINPTLPDLYIKIA